MRMPVERLLSKIDEIIAVGKEADAKRFTISRLRTCVPPQLFNECRSGALFIFEKRVW